MAPAQTNKPNRVFIDSSVLIAAAISERGAARDLLRQGFRGEVNLYISPEVLKETERNLALKAPEALAAFHSFRELLTATLVDPPQSLILSVAKIVEAKDAPIVAAAVEANAPHLATYDRKHLLSHKDEIEAHFGVIAATPDEVLAAQRKRQ